MSERAESPLVEGVTVGLVDAARVATTTSGPRSETCRSARRGVEFYRGRYYDHRASSGAVTQTSRATDEWKSKRRACPRVRFLARIWKSRAFVARTAAEYYATIRTLRDFPFRPGVHAWPKAVDEVQRVFPGTSSWLMSCSAAEGGHGRWVGYSGVPYSTWLRDSDTVGGPLQFRWSTFRGMFRRGREEVLRRGYRLPPHLQGDLDDGTAWRSALGQAIAGGWARYTGNDDSHWSASWGRGC